MKKFVLPIISVLILVGIDQLTKMIARTTLIGSPIVLINGVLEFRYVENTGAAFGILKDNAIGFAIVSVIVLVLLIYLYIKIPADKKYNVLKVIIVFIVSGAIGNLIDRVFAGYVTDFIYISLIDFPVFNVADIFVSWSAVLAFILLLFKYKDGDFNFLKKHED